MVIHPHSTALKGKVHIQCQHTITVTPQLFWRTSPRCSSITKRERQADRHSYINTDRDKRERIKMEKGWESDKELKTKQTCGLLWKVVWDKAAHCFRTCFWFALKFCPKWNKSIQGLKVLDEELRLSLLMTHLSFWMAEKNHFVHMYMLYNSLH